MKKNAATHLSRFLLVLTACLMMFGTDSLSTQVSAKTSSYSIKFHANGGKGKMTNQTCKTGRKVRLKKNKFKKSGYSFTGWGTKKKGSKKTYPDRSYVKNLTSGKSVTLYAQWGKNYTVKFNANGGTVAKKSKTVVSKQKYGTLPTPVKNGYDFKGWYTKKKGGKKVLATTTVKLKKGQTLYAHWKLATYSITYHLNGGTNASGNPATYKFTSNTITLQDPVRHGYTFEGWYKTSYYSGRVTSIPKGSYGNLQLYAKWTAIRYNITYHLDGGRNHSRNFSTYTIETARTIYSPSKTGYSFLGWFADSNYTVPFSVISKGSTGDLNLYAKWSLDTYTIAYETNGGTVTGTNPSTYTYISGPHTLQPAEKRGYEFNGWRINSSTGRLIDTIYPNDLHENLTLYADFEAIPYQITYHLNQDEAVNHPNNPASYTIENTTYTLRDAELDGYAFKGWFRDAELSEPVTKIQTDGCVDLELYAAWEKIPVTRLQYIKDILSALEISPEKTVLPTDDEDNICCSFDDIQGLSYDDILAVETAVISGILEVPDKTPEQEAFFYPKKAADRDFAAYAAVNALGFMGSDPIVCTDIDDIEHPVHAAVAVKQQLMTLDSDNTFAPERFLQEEEETAVLEKIKEIAASEPTELESIDNVVLADGVADLTGVNYTVEETSQDAAAYTITADKTAAVSALTVGDIAFFPANAEHPSGFAVKVVSIQSSDTSVVLTASKPDDISEVLSDVDISGYGTIENPNLLTVTTPEGITAEYDPNGTIDDPDGEATADLAVHVDQSGDFAVPGTINFKFANAKISSNTSLNGSIKVSIPSIAYRLNMDFGLTHFDINDLYLAVTEKVAMEGDVSTTLHAGGIADKGAIEIGRVPMPLGPSGFSVDLVFWFNYSVSGKAKITYSLQATQGIQYINGDLRVIKDSSSSLSAEAYGAFEAGPKLSLMLTFGEIFDLVDITGDIGGGVKADVNARDSGLVCADLGTYVYLTISAGDNSLIGDLLNLKYVWYVWGNTDSPFRKNFHAEGNGIDFSTWHTVEQCTYGTGTLSGSVIMADSRAEIPNAAIRIYKKDGQLIKTLYSDSNGRFSAKLSQGDYTVMVSASGFLCHMDSIVITDHSNTYLDTALMVDTVTVGNTSTISGEILDSISGEPVDQASLSVFRGYNNTSGDALLSTETDQKGRYALTLTCGNYTLKFSKKDYIDTIMNVTVAEQPTVNMNGEMTRLITGDPSGMLRIVLTWGEYPEDLDSHLVGPSKNGLGRFHVYYSDRDYYYGGNTIVNLDRDDTDSYGPETTAVYSLNDTGTYSFYVHDFTNYSGGSDDMSFSNAKVKVYYSGALIGTYQVPYNQPGTMWHVFDFDAGSKTITPRNIMTTDDYGELYDASASETSNLETSDLDLILEDITKHKK